MTRGCPHLLLLAALLAAGCSCDSPTAPREQTQVRIGEHTWTVTVANTPEQHQAGLSGQSDLPADSGMLFVYPSPRPLTFCMRGCSHPLDILFLDAKGLIVNLSEMYPESNGGESVAYASNVPAQYALELKGGTIRRLGLKVGMTVEMQNVPAAKGSRPE